ncbi:MAG: glycine cleavage system aminomethyltransferase GcvT [Gammaproteobacteria bacterium]
MTDSLHNTPLLDWHRKRGGRLNAFAGWRLPVFYDGVINEHLRTRASASLFDVSHMAQIAVRGDALARLSTADPSALAVGECKYAALLLDSGGIVDDFIVGNDGDGDYFCIFNAARKTQVTERLRAASAVFDDRNKNGARALLAVQGPKSSAAVSRLFPAAARLAFMHSAKIEWRGEQCRICRCGYTGEDGFEIGAPAGIAEQLADALLADGAVLPAGLGARDSLRLEAGLCLYGNELNEQTTPAEAGLLWIIGKDRLQNGNFAGADVLREQKANGAARKLVGLLPQSKIPVRGGAQLVIGDNAIGEVSSGLFSPTLGAPVAMGFVRPEYAKKGEGSETEEGAAKTQAVEAIVRGKKVPCRIVKPPFVPHRYAK